MSSRSREREEGYYWIRYEYPVATPGGGFEEHWTEPMLARYEEFDWRPLIMTGGIDDQSCVEVLSERLVEPVIVGPPKSKNERLAERIVKLVEKTTEVEFGREQLVAAIVEVLRT